MYPTHTASWTSHVPDCRPPQMGLQTDHSRPKAMLDRIPLPLLHHLPMKRISTWILTIQRAQQPILGAIGSGTLVEHEMLGESAIAGMIGILDRKNRNLKSC